MKSAPQERAATGQGAELRRKMTHDPGIDEEVPKCRENQQFEPPSSNARAERGHIASLLLWWAVHHFLSIVEEPGQWTLRFFMVVIGKVFNGVDGWAVHL